MKKFPGVMELERVTDAYSDPIDIPGGLIFGHEIVTTAYVRFRIKYNTPFKYTVSKYYRAGY